MEVTELADEDEYGDADDREDLEVEADEDMLEVEFLKVEFIEVEFVDEEEEG